MASSTRRMLISSSAMRTRLASASGTGQMYHPQRGYDAGRAGGMISMGSDSPPASAPSIGVCADRRVSGGSGGGRFLVSAYDANTSASMGKSTVKVDPAPGFERTSMV